MSLISLSSSPNHDSVIGCIIIPRHGLAGGCAAVHKSTCLYGASGFFPRDMDQGLDPDATAAAPGQGGDADAGSGGVGLVDVDAPPDLDR
eukprot:6055882-Pyramimonas_sp.AAC.1